MSRRIYVARVLAIAASLVVMTCAAADAAGPVRHATTAASGCKRVTSDFNGDGHRDAVTVSQLAIDIWYGSPHGFSTSPNLVIGYAELGIASVVSDALDGPFGAFHRGFFNRDCYADLAIALNSTSAGLLVLYGGRHGLIVSRHRTIAAARFEPHPSGSRGFGQFAVGDFNSDGIDDVAIGDAMTFAWEDEEQNVAIGAGSVTVLFGSRHGLVTRGRESFTQSSAGIAGAARIGNSFGYALAAGDFNGDGKRDLAIGAAQVHGGGRVTITVMVGTGHGLTGEGSHTIRLSTRGMPRVPGESGPLLKVGGNFNGDRYTDLLVGALYAATAPVKDAIPTDFVLYGSGRGITTAGAITIRSTTPGMPHGTGKNFDQTYQTGDFNGDGFTDVAFGESILKIGTIHDAGAVVVLYGSHSGLRTAGSVLLTAVGAALVESAEFGRTLGVLPSTRSAPADLLVTADGVVGAPIRAVFLLKGGSHGLSSINFVRLEPSVD